MADLDREDNREGITYQQFMNAFTIDLVGIQSKDHIANIFHLVDEDNSGTIKLDDMVRLVQEIGETISPEELKEMIKKVSGNKEEITFEDFYAALSRRQII